MKFEDTGVIEPLISRQRIIGLAGGALWLMAISAVFVTWSLLVIGTPWARLALVIAVIVIMALMVISVVVIRKALHLPNGSQQRTSENKFIRRRFLWVVGGEVAAFSVVNPLVASTGHFELMPSLNLIIVGIHFFPLAWICRVPRYHLMGFLFCAVPMVTLLAIPRGLLVGDVLAWYIVPSLGCGLVASLTAAAGLREAWQSISDSRASAV